MTVQQSRNQTPRKPNSKLATLVGVPASLILLSLIPMFEGNVLYGYLDPVGILTKCAGDTTDVELGKEYTEAECFESLEKQIIAHAEPVLNCTPIIKNNTYVLVAAVSFAYNIGGTAYCASDTAKRFNAGNFADACKAINEKDNGNPQWVYAGGKVLPGLVKRRAKERAICEKGIL